VIDDLIAPCHPDACQQTITVRAYDDSDADEWDEFVSQHPHGSPFHLLAWKRTIEQSFGYPAMYVVATDGDRIAGVLPLFLVRNIVIGKALISTPFAVYGGILASNDACRKSIHAYVVELGHKLGVDRVELRNSVVEQCVTGPNVDRYVAFTQYLTPDEDSLLDSLPKKTRNVVRKALKQGFEARNHAGLRHFEDLYAKNMRRLGTPCFPSAYFKNLVNNFGEKVEVREVWLEGKPMAASFSFLFRGEMHIYYAAADTKYNALAPNTFMYFDHLRWAGANGFTAFDFGRCKRNTGVFDFKSRWNTVMRELPYEVIPVRCKEIPNFSPTNQKFHFAIQLWSRIPLWLTRLIGPRLIRLFP
jgi:FemAB-related protein (PEP-CTERM system-associated)